jgi:glycosyltransferase involved in cell wall biosynthesis
MPKVTVIIPAYNQADYLGAAIESVLRQSYTDWELIVVNDASPDQTNAIVAHYPDERIRLLVHEQNRGLPAARNTGMRAAMGEIFMLLDADDLFHSEKMAAHVAFLAAHPEVGVSYNARYEIGKAGEILALWRPTCTATFADMVNGFPFAPSDMVLRREWAFRVDLFDESYVAMSEDLDINCRLALAGCHFAGINRPLNYRRYYPNRVIRNVPARLAAAEQALTTLFCNPTCPPEIAALQDMALANANLVWSYEGFIAGLTEHGQAALRKAVKLNPILMANQGTSFLEFLVDRTIQDGGDHALAIHRIMDQLPLELNWIAGSTAWVIGQADLRAGLRDYLWGRTAQGEMYLMRAAAQEIRVQPALLRLLVDHLLSHSQEEGMQASQVVLRDLTRILRIVAAPADIRWLEGCYWLNQALYQFKAGAYCNARQSVLQAFLKDPIYLRNRGAWATLVRSCLSSFPTLHRFALSLATK